MSSDWIPWLLILIVSLAVMFSAGGAILHRRDARKNDRFVGSLWYHMQASYTERVAASDLKKSKQDLDVDIPVKALARTVPDVGVEQRVNKLLKKRQQQQSTVKEPLDLICFFYRDKTTKIESSRKVAVFAVDDRYLEGYCYLRNDTRTFATRNVVGEITSLHTGEICSPSAWARSMRRRKDNVPISMYANSKTVSSRRDWQTAAYFIGFREQKRAELEAIAVGAGWQIRTGFSDSLDTVIYGSLAGAAQKKEAAARGISIVSEDEFRDLCNE